MSDLYKLPTLSKSNSIEASIKYLMDGSILIAMGLGKDSNYKSDLVINSALGNLNSSDISASIFHPNLTVDLKNYKVLSVKSMTGETTAMKINETDTIQPMLENVSTSLNKERDKDSANIAKNCIQQKIEILSKYEEALNIMKNLYYLQYYYLSTSVDIKLLGGLWQSFIDRNKGHEDELSCFVALKMLQKDDFAFSIYQELHPDFITYEKALNDTSMDAYFDREGLTDGSLAYLNALIYLGNLNEISLTQE